MRNALARTILLSTAFVAVAASLTGCDKTREVFGLKRQNMDEFDVMDREPLSTPPNYALRPPLPNAPSVTVTNSQTAAKAALTGQTVTTSQTEYTTQSASETLLLDKAGATNADSSIRAELTNETAKVADEGEAPGADLVFWKKSNSQKSGDVIDPIEENKRAREVASDQG